MPGAKSCGSWGGDPRGADGALAGIAAISIALIVMNPMNNIERLRAKLRLREHQHITRVKRPIRMARDVCGRSRDGGRIRAIERHGTADECSFQAVAASAVASHLGAIMRYGS